MAQEAHDVALALQDPTTNACAVLTLRGSNWPGAEAVHQALRGVPHALRSAGYSARTRGPLVFTLAPRLPGLLCACVPCAELRTLLLLPQRVFEPVHCLAACETVASTARASLKHDSGAPSALAAVKRVPELFHALDACVHSLATGGTLPSMQSTVDQVWQSLYTEHRSLASSTHIEHSVFDDPGTPVCVLLNEANHSEAPAGESDASRPSYVFSESFQSNGGTAIHPYSWTAWSNDEYGIPQSTNDTFTRQSRDFQTANAANVSYGPEQASVEVVAGNNMDSGPYVHHTAAIDEGNERLAAELPTKAEGNPDDEAGFQQPPSMYAGPPSSSSMPHVEMPRPKANEDDFVRMSGDTSLGTEQGKYLASIANESESGLNPFDNGDEEPSVNMDDQPDSSNPFESDQISEGSFGGQQYARTDATVTAVSPSASRKNNPFAVEDLASTSTATDSLSWPQTSQRSALNPFDTNDEENNEEMPAAKGTARTEQANAIHTPFDVEDQSSEANESESELEAFDAPDLRNATYTNPFES